jgi:hypothetical protein
MMPWVARISRLTKREGIGNNVQGEVKGSGLTPWTAASLLVLDSGTWTGTRRKVAGVQRSTTAFYAQAAELISNIYNASEYSNAFRGTQGMVSTTSVAFILLQHTTTDTSRVLKGVRLLAIYRRIRIQTYFAWPRHQSSGRSPQTRQPSLATHRARRARPL